MALTEEEKAKIIEEEELRNKIRNNNPQIFDFSADGLWNSFVGSVKLALILLLVLSAGGAIAWYFDHGIKKERTFLKPRAIEDYNISNSIDVKEYLFSREVINR